MRLLADGHSVFVGFATAALLAGCGSGSQIAPHLTSNFSFNIRESVSGVCIKQASSPSISSSTSTSLLYVSLNETVCAYSYPVGRLHEPLTLKGFVSAIGLCSDSAGNIFVVDQGASDIVEFAHGGTIPIQTLTQPRGEELLACSVDPRTGDLAVTSVGTESDGLGYVVVFPHASGSGKTYSSGQFTSMLYCAYDSNGDLLVDGVSNGSNGNTPEFAEIPFGSHALKPVTMNQKFNQYPGDVQWDGKYWAVGNDQPEDEIIYRFALNDGLGRKVGSTKLLNISGGAVFTIYRSNVLMLSYNASFNYGVQFFKYPAGGDPFKTITKGVFEPRSLTVSRGAKT